jgi:uncharacterized protein
VPRCLMQLRGTKGKRFILFCDDLSFEAPDASYKSLKAALEGGIRPSEHLRDLEPAPSHAARDAGERALHRHHSVRAVEEKVSLSRPLWPTDRLPQLQLGLLYIDMVRGYAEHYGLSVAEDHLRREALTWALAHGARSGRVAFQYIQDLAGRLGGSAARAGASRR